MADLDDQARQMWGHPSNQHDDDSTDDDGAVGGMSQQDDSPTTHDSDTDLWDDEPDMRPDR